MEYKCRVMLVEDDEDDYILFRDYISEMRDITVDLTWISDYDEAIETLFRNQYDLCFLDYRLGERTGLELLRDPIIKNISVPFILLTGQGDREIDIEAMEAGASEYLIKGELNPYLLERTLRYTIEKDKLMKEITRLSLTDELTGIKNRKGFMSLAEQQLKLAVRSKKPLSLLFADLDNMKWINDNLGHEQGDEALIALSTIMQDSFRESDICARLGGDEFTVMMIDCEQDKAIALNERMLKSINDVNQSGKHEFTLALSTGLAHFDPESPSTLDALLSLADELMYEQKKINKGDAVR